MVMLPGRTHSFAQLKFPGRPLLIAFFSPRRSDASVHLRLAPFLLLLSLLNGFARNTDLEGWVNDPSGTPVLHARVTALSNGTEVFTDAKGHFLLRQISVPTELWIEHPRFLETKISLSESWEESLSVVLHPRKLPNEKVIVSADLPSRMLQPVGAAVYTVEPTEQRNGASSLAELVEALPGVSLNGQAGLQQTYSIRGSSKNRIQNNISGVRLTSERRAGTSASFLDPRLFGSVALIRGPASSFFGSGALGGVVDVVPRFFRNQVAEFGYTSEGHGTYLLGGWGNSEWSVGMVHRRAENAYSADSTEINSHFNQLSTVIQRVWEERKRRHELIIIPSWGTDIGKANTDFPLRTTNYPRERHLIVKFLSYFENHWSVETFLHAQDLKTRAEEDSLTAQVVTDSVDLGVKAQRSLAWGNSKSFDVGMEYFGRKSVDAVEAELRPGESSYLPQTETSWAPLQGGGEDELGLFCLANARFRLARVNAGARWTGLRQGEGQRERLNASALSGFLSGSVPIEGGFELKGSVGTGLRFPSLSERFFSGTTGRGQIVGNRSLEPERSLNIEGGISYVSSKVFASAHFFRNGISDYIERIELSPDLSTFENLIRGTIKGSEWEFVLYPESQWQIYFRGHLLKGYSREGIPLADIPVARTTSGFRRRTDRQTWGFEWQFRDRKSNPGSGEKPIESAQLLSTFLNHDLSERLTLHVTAHNLLNQEFFPSADRKAAQGTGTSLSIGLFWTIE